MKIAALQYTPVRAEPAENRRRIGRLLAGVEADLCVLPELATTGYFFADVEELRPLSETAGEGPFAELLREHARDQGMTVIAGYSERAGDRLYNAAIAIRPDGSWVNYRKTHLFYREADVFWPGDTGFFVFEVDGIRVGTMICYDWRFPESARTLRLKGAQIVAHPSNLVATREIWRPATAVRAFENRMFILTANRAGTERVGDEELTFSGGSAIFDVSGRVLGSLENDDGPLICEIDVERTTKTSFNGINDIIGDRRPDMYDL